MTCLYDTRAVGVVELCGCRKCAIRIKMRTRTYKPSHKKTLNEIRLDRELDLVFERESNK